VSNASKPNDLAEIVARCRLDARAMRAVGRLYRSVDAAIARGGARCLGGGMCCKFDLADHRLYVSTLELAYLSRQPPADRSAANRLRCPYQVGPRCMARDNRPLGCRTFFCREIVTNGQPSVYEQFHGRLRLMHQKRCIAYVYVELTGSLRQLFGTT